MIPHCNPKVERLPEQITDLEKLNQWLTHGDIERFAIVRGDCAQVKCFWTIEELIEQVAVGDKIIKIKHFEKNTMELVMWAQQEIREGRFKQI